MARNFSTEILDALETSPVRTAFMFQGEFASTTLRLWDGDGPLVWDELTYNGNGWLQPVRLPADTDEIRSEGFIVSLSSVPLEVIALTLNEARQNMLGTVYLGLLDGLGQLISDPAVMCSGLLDVPEFVDDGSTATVTLSYESEFHDLRRPNELRYTDVEQQRLFSGDTGFRHIAGLVNKKVYWHQSAVGFPNGG